VLIDVMKRLGAIAWSDDSDDSDRAAAIKAALESAKPCRQGPREGFLVNAAGWGRRDRDLLREQVIGSLLDEIDDDTAHDERGHGARAERTLGNLPYVRRLRVLQDSL
jgi:hypothetical protein